MSEETDQLLLPDADVSPDAVEEATPPIGRLDKFQLFIVFCIQIAEPITATVIFPFVNQFIRETGITGGDERKTGYYAGVIESMFFVTECLTVYHWGRASDQIGRKPILVAGLVGLVLVTLGFGLSTGFWMMLLWRSAQGVFNGNIGVTKSVMAEISDPSTIAYAFSTMSIMWASGVTIGPIMGGLLARPADRWPNPFGRFEFFSTFPYFLPCAAAASIVAFSAVLSSICLRETLPSIVEKKSGGEERNGADIEAHRAPGYGSINNGRKSSPPRKPPTFKSLLKRRTLIPMINMGYLAFVNQSIVVLLPLMFSSSIPLGGLGMSPFQIGVIMSAWGIANGLVQLFAFRPIHHALGPRTTYMMAFGNQITLIVLFGLMSYLAKLSGGMSPIVWAILVLYLAINTLTSMAYSTIHIFVIDSADTDNLGSVNGLSQMAASIMRSLAPSFTSSLFSISLQKHLLGGYLVYLILVVISMTGIYASTYLPKELRSRH